MLQTCSGLNLRTRGKSWSTIADELWRFVLFSEFVFDLPEALLVALADIPHAPDRASAVIERYCESSQDFDRDEWLDVILRSVGLEPRELSQRVKFHFIARLAPLVESNFNFIELGPRGSQLANWPDRVRVISRSQPLLAPPIDQEVYDQVCQGLLEGRQLYVQYRTRSRGNELKSYRVHPFALVSRDPVTYLVATLRDYTDVRQLALHRVEAAELLEDPVVPPEGFDVDAYIEEERAFDLPEQGEPIDLELRISAGVAEHLGEAPLVTDQVIEACDDGWCTLWASVPLTAQLRWWLLGFGQAVQVIEPQALRKEIAAELRAAAHAYE
ncbi:WYL domain-containing protein [Halorhodospira halochloris]|uniref:helix-turn-helix transcriptional regulator n=1 Tax=Halorhodospira halochloris TaxID=1052 RepID=UPI001EE889CD|nr:WYL domain-containing protein [Halorhodospira halochloris]MCG5531554.1 WYL domain-containing protein [Halorhodospira halochloris]